MEVSEDTLKLCYLALNQVTIKGSDWRAVGAAMQELESVLATKKQDPEE